MPRREATFEELEAALRLDRDALDTVIMEQPEVYYEVAKQLTLAISRADADKQALQEAEAEEYLKIRQQSIDDNVKRTEVAIAAELAVRPRLQELQREVADRASRVGLLRALEQAFRQRNDAIERTLRLHMSQFYDPIRVDRAARPLHIAEGEQIRRERERGDTVNTISRRERPRDRNR
jgi:hypothetical protein